MFFLMICHFRPEAMLSPPHIKMIVTIVIVDVVVGLLYIGNIRVGFENGLRTISYIVR